MRRGVAGRPNNSSNYHEGGEVRREERRREEKREGDKEREGDGSRSYVKNMREKER